MIFYKNLYIIGTSHISPASVNEVESVLSKIRPEIIALELDKRRLPSLMSGKKSSIRLIDIKKVGLKGFLFNIIGAYAEKRLGRLTGISPGSEMKKAIEIARKLNSKIALIDQDIEITLKKLSERITLKEKLTFLKDLLLSSFTNQKIDFDIHKVPSQTKIKKMTLKIKKDYPSFYQTLIVERNIYMAKALYNILTENQSSRIVAIVGAGHEQDILEIIKNVHKKRGK